MIIEISHRLATDTAVVLALLVLFGIFSVHLGSLASSV